MALFDKAHVLRQCSKFMEVVSSLSPDEEIFVSVYTDSDPELACFLAKGGCERLEECTCSLTIGKGDENRFEVQGSHARGWVRDSGSRRYTVAIVAFSVLGAVVLTCLLLCTRGRRRSRAQNMDEMKEASDAPKKRAAKKPKQEQAISEAKRDKKPETKTGVKRKTKTKNCEEEADGGKAKAATDKKTVKTEEAPGKENQNNNSRKKKASAHSEAHAEEKGEKDETATTTIKKKKKKVTSCAPASSSSSRTSPEEEDERSAEEIMSEPRSEDGSDNGSDLDSFIEDGSDGGEWELGSDHSGEEDNAAGGGATKGMSRYQRCIASLERRVLAQEAKRAQKQGK